MKMIRRTTPTMILLAATGVLPLIAAQPAAESGLASSLEEKSLESEYEAARGLLKANEGEESSNKGFRMMLAAAEKGYLPAIAGVAYLYNVGLGTPKDNAAAARWFRLAAEKEHAISRYNLGKLLVNDEIPLPEGSTDRKTQHEEGVEWIRKAADQGLSDAQAAYGVILLRGDYATKPDPAAAAGYLKPAAETGNLEAMNALGLMHQTGNGVVYDLSASERFFRQAAMRGHVKAQANLGEHLNPLSKKPDQRVEALAWLFIAEEADDAVAKKLLAIKSQAISRDDAAAGKKKAAEIKRTIREKNQ
jgi:TPR repeat protein